MLTAETEGGNRKSHPYWIPADYGPFKVKSLSERRAALERKDTKTLDRALTATPKSSHEEKPRPSVGRRHSSKPSFSFPRVDSSKSPSSSQQSPVGLDQPHVIIRKLALSNTNAPFQPLREITQLQYPYWPDFGAPAHPAHVLGLVERCDEVVRSYEQGPKTRLEEPVPQDQRPIVVHCSAGCGRTGTFCTIDSVVDMLKRQRSQRHQKGEKAETQAASTSQDNNAQDAMDVDAPSSQQSIGAGSTDDETWLYKDDVDLVGRTVADFRLQRLSMVQTLRQFVLCYESVLEWIAGEVEEGKLSTWSV